MPDKINVDEAPTSTFGRYTEMPLDKMTPEQKKAYDYIVKERGQAPGPYKIWLQNPKLLEVMAPVGVYFQKHSTLTKPEIEIATNIICARWLTAYSNYEHEMIGETAGLPELKVQALIAGLPTSFDDARQQVVYEMAMALVTPRRVPAGLWQRAVKLLGDAGLTDLTVLIGYYSCVSFTLSAYDVPAGAAGLER